MIYSLITRRLERYAERLRAKRIAENMRRLPREYSAQTFERHVSDFVLKYRDAFLTDPQGAGQEEIRAWCELQSFERELTQPGPLGPKTTHFVDYKMIARWWMLQDWAIEAAKQRTNHGAAESHPRA